MSIVRMGKVEWQHFTDVWMKIDEFYDDIEIIMYRLDEVQRYNTRIVIAGHCTNCLAHLK